MDRESQEKEGMAEMPLGGKAVWFPAKRYGWGWGFPNTWQGGVVVVTWLIGVLAGTLALLRTTWTAVLLIPFLAVMVGLLLVICWIKGERPRWRWGDEKTPADRN